MIKQILKFWAALAKVGRGMFCVTHEMGVARVSAEMIPIDEGDIVVRGAQDFYFNTLPLIAPSAS